MGDFFFFSLFFLKDEEIQVMQEYTEYEHQRTREKREKALIEIKVKGGWTMRLLQSLDSI